MSISEYPINRKYEIYYRWRSCLGAMVSKNLKGYRTKRQNLQEIQTRQLYYSHKLSPKSKKATDLNL